MILKCFEIEILFSFNLFYRKAVVAGSVCACGCVEFFTLIVSFRVEMLLSLKFLSHESLFEIHQLQVPAHHIIQIIEKIYLNVN